MYAIIEDGGKQYKVARGAVVEVELLPAAEGESVELDRVLLVSQAGQVTVGTPTVPGAKVLATVQAQGQGPKIIVFRYKAKTRQHKKKGHRQPFTKVKIDKISAK